MGNQSSLPSPPSSSACPPAKVRHLVVFSHGLTKRCTRADLTHGLALLQAHSQCEQKDSCIILSRANAGDSGNATFKLTMQGVEQGGAALAREIVALLSEHFTSATHLSLVGGSMGGLFARAAAAILFNGGCSVITERGIRPHALITLATPHLSVYNLSSSLFLYWGAWLAKGPAELCLNDTALDELARSSRDVLANFQHRVAYAPVINDGVVAWSTAALSLRAHPRLVDSESVILSERLLSAAENACEWIPEMDNKSDRVVLMAKMLVHSPWLVVDVAMAHKHLATLYPLGPHASKCAQVARHVLTFLAIPSHETKHNL